jgi:hypothetical protein
MPEDDAAFSPWSRLPMTRYVVLQPFPVCLEINEVHLATEVCGAALDNHLMDRIALR